MNAVLVEVNPEALPIVFTLADTLLTNDVVFRVNNCVTSEEKEKTVVVLAVTAVTTVLVCGFEEWSRY